MVSPTRSGKIRATGPSLPRDCDQRLLPQPKGFLVSSHEGAGPSPTIQGAPPAPASPPPPLPEATRTAELEFGSSEGSPLCAALVNPSRWQPTRQSPPDPAPPARIQEGSAFSLPAPLLPASPHSSSTGPAGPRAK